MILRIRSRDGLERITIPNPASATVSTVRSLIESQLGVPSSSQTLSLDPKLLLSSSDNSSVQTLSDPSVPISSLGLAHGSLVFLSYNESRHSAPPPPPRSVFAPAGSFGRNKMTIDDLIARQIRITRQENPHCVSASFDRASANAFQLYVSETLAFSVKRGAFLYGEINSDSSVSVEFIYEPPQQGTEDVLTLLPDPEEEKLVDAIAIGLGMRRVGFIFTQAVGRKKSETGEYTLSAREVAQAVALQAEGQAPEWVTAVVKLEVDEDGGADVHFEAFQMSDMCAKLFKDGLLDTEFEKNDDPRVLKVKKEVVVGSKDSKEVDNDFFLVPVKIADHQGPLQCTFPVENRITTVSLRALKTHLDKTKHLPFVKRISDFHLLLMLSKFLDVNSDVPALAECVKNQGTVPEGYQLLIESLAATS
ncbi:hypothetical protein LUZ60_011614 [Juncus effusus]|nr:hypothetical protein LUZ60_011614 [Juncus effusus]